MGYFSAFQSIDQISLFKKYAPDIQFNTFFYTSLIQTGANLIEIIDDPTHFFSSSKTIEQRLLEADRENYKKICIRTENIFIKYANFYKNNKELKDTLHDLKMLIIDLIYCSRKGSDFIFVGDMPSLEKYENILPSELYFPIKNLLSFIENGSIFITSPIGIIPSSEVRKFDSIIKSDIYVDYAKSQQMLFNNNIDNVKENIRIASEKLIASKPLFLSIYNNITSLLPLTKLINSQVGEFANIAKDFLTKNTALDNRQNIVIYRYKDIALNHFKKTYDISFQRLEDDLFKWSKEAIFEAKVKKIKEKDLLPYVKKYITSERRKKLDKL